MLLSSLLLLFLLRQEGGKVVGVTPQGCAYLCLPSRPLFYARAVELSSLVAVLVVLEEDVAL